MQRKYIISYRDLIVWCIILLLVQFFNIIPSEAFNRICGNQQEILVVVMIAIYYLVKRRVARIQASDIFGRMIILFVLYYFVELVVSAVRNGQGIINAFIASNFYLTIFFYFICSEFCLKKGKEKFFQILIILSAIRIALCWLQYILVSSGIIFMSSAVISVRFGSIRLYNFADALNCLGIIVAFAFWMEKYKSRKYGLLCLFICIFGFLGMLIVSKGRLQMLALCVAIYMIIYAKYHNRAKIFLYIGIILIAVVVFLQTPLGETYLDSITNIETDTLSVRGRELEYYNSQTKEHLLLGVGFIRDNGDAMSDYLTGPVHQYSRTDIGIFGVANSLGLIGVAWYIITSMICAQKIYRIGKRKRDVGYYVLVGMFVYSIFCIPTVILFNAYGVTSYAIILALVEAGYRLAIKTDCKQQ